LATLPTTSAQLHSSFLWRKEKCVELYGAATGLLVIPVIDQNSTKSLIKADFWHFESIALF
jgi:hypothetical protein